MKQIKILENTPIAPGAYTLSMERIFDFTPGQVVGITTSPELPPRLYSICSANTDRLLDILYTVKPSGSLTPQLSQLKAGDKLYVSEPKGKFISTSTPSVWIAAGTGIAPFVSMYLSGNQHHKTLIHGARHLSDFYFEELFKPALGSHYIRCCSAEQNNDVYAGRITQYLKESASLPPDQMYYLCGSSEMVVETRDILISRGIPFANINSEIYF